MDHGHFSRSGQGLGLRVQGLGVNYVWQKLNIDLAYQSFKSENALRGVQVAAALPSGSNINGTSLKDNQMYAGATYDFGILKAYASYINRKDTNNFTTTEFLKRSGQQIGVRSYVTPTIEAWANIGNGDYVAYGTGSPTANFTAYQVGGNYYLSKRTNLYTIFGSTQTSSTSSTASYGSNAYAVGVRHTF